MKSWALFMHSVRQVMGNLPAALRISGVLFGVQTAVALIVGGFVAAQANAGGSVADVLILPALIIVGLMVLIGLWIGVAWHRYVLTEELDPGLLPAFHGRRIAAYLGMGLLVGLVLVLPLLVLNAVAQMFLAAPAWGGDSSYPIALVLDLGLQAVLGGLAFRLATVLPGVAMEPGHGILEGWNATRGQTLILMGLALICGVILTAMQVLLTAIPLALLQLPLAIIAQWLTTMVGVSILTTLYGHYIQGRALVA